MTETALIRSLMKEASVIGLRLFRNNTGRIQTKSSAWIQYGLCVGSSDLIGWRSITIRPDMVDQKIAIFTAIEAKSPTGRLTEEQENFLSAVHHAGGIAIEARSIEDLNKI